jgi:hypothetical protein
LFHRRRLVADAIDTNGDAGDDDTAGIGNAGAID